MLYVYAVPPSKRVLVLIQKNIHSATFGNVCTLIDIIVELESNIWPNNKIKNY